MQNLKIFSLLSVAGLSVFALCGCAGPLSQGTVDLNKYVVVTYSGYDGRGIATVGLDTEAIEEDYGGQDVPDGILSVNDGMTLADIINGKASVSLDISSGLSNGDTVIVSWGSSTADIGQYVDAGVDFSSLEYTVEGLDEIATVDVFEGVDVTFSGQSSSGTAAIGARKYCDYGTFSCSPDEGLSNGDEVTVTYQYNSEGEEGFIMTFNAVPETFEKTYIVEGLEE